MTRLPPRSTPTSTLFPFPTLFLSGRLPRTAGRVSLALDLGAQVLGIAPDRRDGEGPAGAAIGHPAVLGLDLPVDLDLVPLCRMADIEDRNVVMHAPEERHGIERLASAQHVACRGLPLALRDNPGGSEARRGGNGLVRTLSSRGWRLPINKKK